MVNASTLPARYGIGKTNFYQRRNYLTELGYDLEPVKSGRTSFYRDEQVQILDKLDAHIKAHGGMEGFPNYSTSKTKSLPDANGKASSLNGHSELVHPPSEQVEIEFTEEEENQLDKKPLEDIKEEQLPLNLNGNSEFKPKKSDVRGAAAQLIRRSALYWRGKQTEPNSSQAVRRERNHILKLFLALQVTGLITGAVLASAARLDLLAGMGLGLGMGSVNFGVSLTLSSRDWSD